MPLSRTLRRSGSHRTTARSCTTVRAGPSGHLQRAESRPRFIRREAQRKVTSKISPASGVYVEFSVSCRGRVLSRSVRFCLNSLIAAVVIVCLLYIAFGSVRNLALVLVERSIRTGWRRACRVAHRRTALFRLDGSGS